MTQVSRSVSLSCYHPSAGLLLPGLEGREHSLIWQRQGIPAYTAPATAWGEF